MTTPTFTRGPGDFAYTIGHGTRSLDEMLALLGRFDVEVLADTRSFPRSRRNPQFNIDTFPAALDEAGIEYQHHRELGGRRTPSPDSLNTAWQNLAFRGYADYMQTGPFREGIAQLEEMARRRTVAVMCSELVWWRCHRRLIADRLTVDGFAVWHIMAPEHEPYPHRVTPEARVDGAGLTYPAIQQTLLER